MVEQKENQKMTLIDRKYLELVGVRHVDTFDEREIVLDTTMGVLLIKGEGLHITKLNLDDGSLSVQGFVNSIQYKEGKSAGGKGRSVLSRLMK